MYTIQINDNQYIKYTSKFGPFYGSIVLTNKKEEAIRFSKEKDAVTRKDVYLWRIKSYTRDKNFSNKAIVIEL